MRYGRWPRQFDSRIPHFSALRYKLLGLPTPAPSLDNTALLPDNLGVMLNDRLGDCGEAGYFHGKQLLTRQATGSMVTVPDQTVEQLYSDGAGYVPSNPSTDQGTDLQTLLKFLVNTGALMPDGTRQKILGFIEVDPQNDNDLALVTSECGFIYLGFNVPAYLQQLEAPGSVWDCGLSQVNAQVIGGHCVISGKYAPGAAGVARGIISWGSKDYTMTADFWRMWVDEAYGIISPDYIEATGKTPFGLTAADWEAQMTAIKEAA